MKQAEAQQLVGELNAATETADAAAATATEELAAAQVRFKTHIFNLSLTPLWSAGRPSVQVVVQV